MTSRVPLILLLALFFAYSWGAQSIVVSPVRANVSGKVFDLTEEGTAQGEPRFLFDSFIVMDRSEQSRPEGKRKRQLVSHFLDRDGKLATAEIVELDGPKVLSYIKDQRQIGVYSIADVSEPGKVLFKRRREDGSFDERVEEISDPKVPAVTGPMVTYFMQQEYARLKVGDTVKFRMVVPDRMETIGFRLKLIEGPSEEGLVLVKMEPSSFIIRMLVQPSLFRINLKKMSLLSVRSRFPLKLKSGNSWKDYSGLMKLVRKTEEIRYR